MIQLVRKYFSVSKNIENLFINVTNNQDFYNLSGIYLIKNMITNDCYIGQSKNIGSRIAGHIRLLKAHRHLYADGQFDLLQKSWDKYGEQAFKYFIVEVCNLELLNNKEQKWIKYFDCNYLKSGNGFNLTDGGDRPPLGTFNKGRIHVVDSTGMIEKVIPKELLDSYLLQGYTRGMAHKEERQAKSKATKIKNNTTKHSMPKHTDKWKEQMSLQMKNRIRIHKNEKEKVVLQEDLDLYLASGWELGNSEFRKKPDKATAKYRTGPLSQEACIKISISKQKPVLKYSLNGCLLAEYDSLLSASLDNPQIGKHAIWKLLHNKLKNKEKYNCVFKYKEDISL